jgi:hypothetical protein
VVALKQGDKIRLGYSLCMVRPSKKSGLPPDKFDKQHGVDLAVGRAVGPNGYIIKQSRSGPSNFACPQSCEKTMLRVAERAVRVFEDKVAK